MRTIVFCPIGKVYLPFGKDFFLRESRSLSYLTWGDSCVEIIDERNFDPKYTPEDLVGVICRPGNAKIIDFFSNLGIPVREVSGTLSTFNKKVLNTEQAPSTQVEKPEDVHVKIKEKPPVAKSRPETKPTNPSFNQILQLPLETHTNKNGILTNTKMHIIIGIRVDDNSIRAENANACLESLTDQDIERTQYTITLVDQSNSLWKNTVQLISFVDKYGYIHSDRPYNRSKAFNDGVRIVNPEDDDILCLMDSDLLVDRDFVKECLRMSNGKDVVIPYDHVKYMAESASIWARNDRLFDAQFKPWKYDGIEKQSHGGVVLVRASAYKHLNGHDEQFEGWGCEDSDFILRALKEFKVWRGNDIMCHMFHPPADKSQCNKENLGIYLSKHPYANTAKRRLVNE